MEYIQEITLDINQETPMQVIKAKQGDNGTRYVKVTMCANGMKLTPPDGATAYIRCQKPDGTYVGNPAQLNTDGTIIAELTDQILAVSGLIETDISLIQDDKVISTVSFYINAGKKPMGESVLSTNEFLEMVKVTDEAKSAAAAANKAAERVPEIIELDVGVKTVNGEAPDETGNVITLPVFDIMNTFGLENKHTIGGAATTCFVTNDAAAEFYNSLVAAMKDNKTFVAIVYTDMGKIQAVFTAAYGDIIKRHAVACVSVGDGSSDKKIAVLYIDCSTGGVINLYSEYMAFRSDIGDSVEVDDSLSVSGQAADAAVVGEKLGDIESSLDSIIAIQEALIGGDSE